MFLIFKYSLIVFVLVENHAWAIISGNPISKAEEASSYTAAFLQSEWPNLEHPLGIERDTCSGSIISATRFITAAHCMKESPIGKKILFDVDVRNKNPEFRVITDFKVHPLYNSGHVNGQMPKNRNDIAILTFEGGIPDGYKKAKILPRDYVIPTNSKITIVGYGIVSFPVVNDQNIVIDPNAWLGDGILRGAIASFKDHEYSNTEIQLFENSQFASSGDSGGPAFININDEIFLLGVDNWGDQSNGVHFEIYADIRAYLDWIFTK